jgi:hypothetical protein
MGLVKFRKNLSYEEFAALSEKNEYTLYFVYANGKTRMHLGSEAYGGTEQIEFETSNSIAISHDHSMYSMTARVSPDEGNSLRMNPDGLYAHQSLMPAIEDPTDGDLVIAADGSVATSRISVVEELSAECNDWMTPSVSAVYNAVSKVAPVWNSETISDNLFPQNVIPNDPAPEESAAHEWVDLLDSEGLAELPIVKDRSFLCSDGETVAFSLVLRVNDLVHVPYRYSAELDKDAILLQIPSSFAPKVEQAFPLASILSYPDGRIESWDCGYLLISAAGSVINLKTLDFNVYTAYDHDCLVIFNGTYLI